MPWSKDGSRKNPALYKKSGFKLGSESRGPKTPWDNKMQFGRLNNLGNINISPLDEGTLAEANMDGSISVDPDINLNSPLGRRVIKHEKKHLEQIESGRAAYDDNCVMWEGKLYIRQDGYIDGPNGRWPEGHPNHPWEQEAINAEKS